MRTNAPASTKPTQAAAAQSDTRQRPANQQVLVDNRPETVAQRKLLDGFSNSPYAIAQRQKLESLFGTPERREEEQAPLQGKFEIAQRMEGAAKPNNTGLPDNLKSGIESLSGISMDNVKVHYNSSQPAQLNALAYAQGTDIHVAPGQEQHLPHEAWHVVQQAQGRVKPTMQMKEGVAVNDDAGLEREADAMGERVTQMSEGMRNARPDSVSFQALALATESLNTRGTVAQRTTWSWVDGAWAAQDEDEPQTAQPSRDGAYAWETIDTGATEEEPAAPVVLTMTFGAAHGDLHFGGVPTANKSKWSITKGEAKTLMEAEMTNRMQDIVAAASASETKRIAWILVADSDEAIGNAVGVQNIRRFQIQLQANLETGDISYHGFPDEQALHTGLGPSRNKLT